MKENFKVGTEVFWKSQSGGYIKHKSGHIRFIVPKQVFPGEITKKEFPDLYNHFTVMFDGLIRNHQSYLVEVREGNGRKPKLYWPLVKNLKTIL